MLGRALKSFGTSLKLWKCYVDDVCTISESLEFITYETENDEGCLPFLDIMIHCQSDGSLAYICVLVTHTYQPVLVHCVLFP